MKRILIGVMLSSLALVSAAYAQEPKDTCVTLPCLQERKLRLEIQSRLLNVEYQVVTQAIQKLEAAAKAESKAAKPAAANPAKESK